MRSQPYVKRNSRRMDKVTDPVSNSSSQKHVPHHVSPSHSHAALPPSPGHPRSSILVDGHFEGSLTEDQAHHGAGKGFIRGGQPRVTIDMVPDVALLEIFDFYIHIEAKVQAWQKLVHVCRKWRILVFGSSRRLKLRLHCTETTPVRDTLDIWPPLPIIIEINRIIFIHWRLDNIIPAFEHNDRICQLNILSIKNSGLKELLPAMQQPFPALTHLKLYSINETAPIDPDLFLGGSAPHLQELFLESISFPGLPKLLLSATHLVTLCLWTIPDSGYILPEAMVTGLSALANLETLNIEFEFPRRHPDQNSRLPLPQTRTLLPTLATLKLQGVCEYLEDLVARIDAPLLGDFQINFFHQLIFDTTQLAQFISRTPKFRAPDEAHVAFTDWGIWITFPPIIDGTLRVKSVILCEELVDLQVSSLAQICSSSFRRPFIHAVQHLYIREDDLDDTQEDIEGSQWLELLHPFTAVKELYVPSKITPFIVLALQELVGERVTEVLPALQTLFLEEPLPSGSNQEAVDQFVAARGLAGHPIAVSRWEIETYNIDEW